MSNKYTDSQIFNFIGGSRATGETPYELWKGLGNEGTAEDFLEYLKDDMVDNTLSETSENSVQNKVVTKKLNEMSQVTTEVKQETTKLKQEIAVERARINTFTELEEGSTTGDAELIDARVDYTGKTWDNVGEHIRGVSSQLSEHKVDNKINVYTRAHTPVDTSTFDFWWTYHALTLKAGVSYSITTVARNCGNTFSYALMNVINNYVESVYSVVDNKPLGEKHTIIVTPKNDSLILFKDLPFSSPYETLELKRTNQAISQGTFVSFEDWTTSTLAFDLTVDALITSDELYNILHRKPYIVSKSGSGNFETIGEAIANTNDGDTIVIMSGIYTEQVKMWGKNRHLIGLSKETVFVVNTDRLYGSEPIQADRGSIKNMTIIGGYGLTPIDRDTTSTSYAIHIEYPNSEDYELVVENCNIISNVAPAIGMGVRHNQKVIIKDCFIETKAKEMYSSVYSNYFNCGAIFCHNDASGSNLGTNGYVSIENCELKGVTTALTLQSQDNGNTLTHRFLKNTLWSTENGKTNAITLRTTPTSGHIVGSDGILDSISFGNNISDLNA